MENSPQVSVVLAPIVRMFRAEGGRYGYWAIAFRLVPRRAEVERAVEAVRAGLRVANAAVAPQTIVGLGAIRVGPTVLIPMYGDGISIDAVERWLRTLARHLEAAGEGGILQLSRSSSARRDRPPVLPGPRKELAPVAYITYLHDNVEVIGDAVVDGWSVASEVRRRLADYAMSWPEMKRGRAWLQLWGAEWPLDPDQIRAAMLAISAGIGGGVSYDAEEPRGERSIALWPGGELVVSSWTVESIHDWRGWVEEITAALLLAPTQTQQAFIHNSFPGSASKLDLYQPHFPERLRPVRFSGMLDCHPDLAQQYVCDAHGRQILNGHHVSRIRDLDRNWEVEEVAVDRYLVSAKDMQPWFGVDITPLEVLHRARRDFFDIILAWEAALKVDPDLESTLVYGREELMKPIDISLA